MPSQTVFGSIWARIFLENTTNPQIARLRKAHVQVEVMPRHVLLEVPVLRHKNKKRTDLVEILVDFHGLFVDFHGFSWIIHGFSWIIHGTSVDYSWIFMEHPWIIHGFSWIIHGLLTLVFQIPSEIRCQTPRIISKYSLRRCLELQGKYPVHTMWDPINEIAKLVKHNSNNYGLSYTNNYSFHGVYKPTSLGGPHCTEHQEHLLQDHPVRDGIGEIAMRICAGQVGRSQNSMVVSSSSWRCPCSSS